MSFTKLHNKLLRSTVWEKPSHIRICWITMLALADRDGQVKASLPGLAHEARLTMAEVEDALEDFRQPDKYSQTTLEGGRRIRDIEGGWELITYEVHRRMFSAEERREKDAERKRKKRAAISGVSAPVRKSPRSPQSPHKADTDTEADTDTKEEEARGTAPPISSPDSARAIPRPRDPMGQSFAGIRDDVAKIWGLWQKLAEKPNAELRRGDPRELLIIERIDGYGAQAVADALLGATFDDWCQGAKDGEKHIRVSYILGQNSPEKFEELMAAGEDHRNQKKKRKLRARNEHKAEQREGKRREATRLDPAKTQDLIAGALKALNKG